MSVNQRIKIFLKKEGVMPVSLKTGISKSALYKNVQLGGMSAEALEKIFLNYPKLNINWFFLGVGNMENSGNVKVLEYSELSEAAEPQTDYAITKVFDAHVGDVQGSGCSMSADGSCMFKNLAKLNEAMKENEELKKRMAVLERQAKRKK